MNNPELIYIPDIPTIEKQGKRLSKQLYKTPIHAWETPRKQALLGDDIKVCFKLELLQKTGSFKIRGAMTVIQHMSEKERACGVVAGTGGNHGIAVAYAAKAAGVHAKVVVPEDMNQLRLNAIESLGAEIITVEDMSHILDTMRSIAEHEKRSIMHPFDDPYVTLGTATLGLEFIRQVPTLDAVIIPIGGGGLIAGMACAIKQVNPNCNVYGVEPVGANSMQRSFAAGCAVALPGKPVSIANSLCAPRAEDYSFAVCHRFVDEIVTIEDNDMRTAMCILFEDAKLALEPAGAAATAALLGPLREQCHGKHVGVIICGTNIDLASFQRLLSHQ